MSKQKNIYKTLSRKLVYQNPWIKLWEDKIIRPDGKKGIYGWVHIPRTVGVIPIDDRGNVYLCKQFRYVFKNDSLEIPRGFVDQGETALQAAKRELKEESGVSAKKIIFLGKIRTSIGVLDEEAKLYLAQKLTTGEWTDKHEINSVVKISLKEAIRLVEKNKILDGLTIAAILLACRYYKI